MFSCSSHVSCLCVLSVLTNVTAAPNNGTQGALYHLLKHAPALPTSDDVIDYTNCTYPETDDVYETRANASDCSCEIGDIRAADDRLNLSDAEKAELEQRHLSYGISVVHADDAATGDTCLLHQTDYVMAYDSSIRMPLFVAFSLTDEQVRELTRDSQKVCCFRFTLSRYT